MGVASEPEKTCLGRLAIVIGVIGLIGIVTALLTFFGIIPGTTINNIERREITEFIESYVKSGEHNDPQVELIFLDNNIEKYFDIEKPNQDKILEARRDHIKKYPERHYTIVRPEDNIQKTISNNSEKFIVRAEVKFSCKDKEKKSTTGSSFVEYNLVKSDGRLKIYSIYEYVTKNNN